VDPDSLLTSSPAQKAAAVQVVSAAPRTSAVGAPFVLVAAAALAIAAAF
jgi:hypothetical protein